MCCFSQKTEVSGTRIFARMARPGVQVLAYQMTFSAAVPTAMILPLPVRAPAGENAVRFKNLKEYGGLFDDLAAGFPEKPSFSLSRSKSAPSAAAAPSLAVHAVGDFVASFVPSVRDFERLDRRFSIAPSVWGKIPAYADYGFAVFQLKELGGSAHPMAFEFDTRLDQSLFFPTVHIHDGSVHDTDAFDHVLYAQAPELDAKVSGYDGPEATDRATGYVRSKDTLGAFADTTRAEGLLEGKGLVHKLRMVGTLPNRDTFLELRPAAAARGCSRCDVGPGVDFANVPLHVGLTMAAFGWIVRRRDRLAPRR